MTFDAQLEVPKSLAIDWWTPVVGIQVDTKCEFFETVDTLTDGTILKAGTLHLDGAAVTIMPMVKYHESPTGQFAVYSLLIFYHYRWWRSVFDRRYASMMLKKREALLDIYRQHGAFG